MSKDQRNMCEYVSKNFPVLNRKDHFWKLYKVRETNLVIIHKIRGGTIKIGLTKAKDKMLIREMGEEGGVGTKIAKLEEEEREDEISRAMEIKCGREGGTKRTFPPPRAQQAQ